MTNSTHSLSHSSFNSKSANQKPTAILKFGGAAFECIEKFAHIASLIDTKISHQFTTRAIVTSAMSGVTSNLISLAQQVSPTTSTPGTSTESRSLCHREHDLLVSSGDRISASLLSIALNGRGVSAQSFTGSQAGIITTTDHSSAKIITIKPWRLKKALEESIIPIVAGFQGVSTALDVTTLGRGGSDISAVALAVALETECVAFFKDVPFLYPKDPKESTQPQAPFHKLSYDSALSLMRSATCAIHPRAIKLAKAHGIKLYFGSFNNIDRYPGTIISAKPRNSDSDRALEAQHMPHIMYEQ